MSRDPTKRTAMSDAMSSLATRVAAGGAQLLRLPPAQLEEDPDNPRRTFSAESIEELAATLKAVGVLHPLLVLAPAPGRPLYRIIDGARRYRAAKLASLDVIPVIAVATMADVPMVQLVANLQREDVSALETAHALRSLQDSRKISRQDELAVLVGKSATWVSRHLALLSLPPDLQSLARDGLLTSYTRLNEVAKLDPAVRDRVVESIRAGQGYEDALLLALNEAAQQGRTLSPASDGKAATHAPPSANQARQRPDADVESLQQRLSEAIGSAVKIKHGKGGKGTLTIAYATLDVLDGIIERMEKR